MVVPKVVPTVESILAVIEKRDRLVQALGGMFQHSKFSIPEQSIYDEEFKIVLR